MLGVFQTITKNVLSLPAMFQNDEGRFLNIANRKLLYTEVTTIFHVVHYWELIHKHFHFFNVEVRLCKNLFQRANLFCKTFLHMLNLGTERYPISIIPSWKTFLTLSYCSLKFQHLDYSIYFVNIKIQFLSK